MSEDKYFKGFCEGVILFARWKDGRQVVGVAEEGLLPFLLSQAKEYGIGSDDEAREIISEAGVKIYEGLAE